MIYQNIGLIRYYIRMSCNLAGHTEAYWSILKTFSNNEKILIIILLLYENRFVIDFINNVQLFNSVFAGQCTVINNSSSLPSELLLQTDRVFV